MCSSQFSTGRPDGNLARKLNYESALFTNAFTITFIRQKYILYVQVTFAQNINEFMNDRLFNAFRHNTACRLNVHSEIS